MGQITEKLTDFRSFGYTLLNSTLIWKSLDVDYDSPRVERLYLDLNGYRYYLHVIHKAVRKTLFHKHPWPSAVQIIDGSYKMGLSYSKEEISSEDAYALPIHAELILTKNSIYEMSEPDALHFVDPISHMVYSIMVTGTPYPDFVKNDLPEMKPLTEERKEQILVNFRNMWY